MSKRNYLDDCEKISNEVKQFVFEEHGWQLNQEIKTCNIYSIPSTRTPKCFVWKGEITIDTSPEKLYDMIHPAEKYRPMWDTSIAVCRVLEELSKTQFVCHQVYKSRLMGFLSARDSIDVFKLEETDDYYSVQFGGIDYEKPVAEVHCERAWHNPAGIFVFKKEKPTKVVVIFQTDINWKEVPNEVVTAGMPGYIERYLLALRGMEDVEWTPLKDVPGRRA